MASRVNRRFGSGGFARPLAFALCFGIGAVACANEPPAAIGDGDPTKTQVVVTVDRTEPSSPDAQGSASAVARFVTVPAYSDPIRVLVAAGATLDLPAPDACQSSDTQDDIEPPLPSQDPVEFVEAGDVAIHANDVTSALVPHAFPTVGAFASGVLYTTKDRAAGALPAGVPYIVSATGSSSVSSLRLVALAPIAPANVQIDGATLSDVADVTTSKPLAFTWNAGDGADLVYVQLLAYDGSPSVVCTFRDEAGSGSIARDTFAGIGSGRLAIHRVRTRHVDATSGPSGDVRFDFEVDEPVEFVK
jgi:hypothetical protein